MDRIANHQMWTALLVFALTGCHDTCCNCFPKDTGRDSTPFTVDTTDSTPIDETGDHNPVGVHGTIQGHVSVTLYVLDESGDIVEIPWDESCFGSTFPYGAIFVGGYTTDEKTGVETYWDQDVIVSPSVNGQDNAYDLTIDADDIDEVYVYAALDKWSDSIIGGSDPIGFYSAPVLLAGGETVNDVDIEISTLYWCGGDGTGTGTGYGSCPDCPPYWGSCYYWDGTQWAYIPGCGGGGCSDGTVSVSGDLIIDMPYNGTGDDVATILMYPGTETPWYVNYGIAVTGDDEGAQGTWGHTYCRNSGSFEARGVWNSNGNELYDPADIWGQPVDSDGNPQGTITFGESDVTNQTMLVPLPGSGIDLVPFVRVSGTLETDGVSYDDIVATYPDAHFYVMAAKYRPDGDFSTETDLDRAYDYVEFGPDDLTGDSLPFMLMAPANSTIYLFGAGDLDNDGSANGPFEGFACYGSDPCSLSTGESNHSGITLTLGLPEKL